MADQQVPLTFQNGLATSPDETRMPEGFVRRAIGVYFKPDDPDRLWKIPGRTLAGTLPSTTGVYGLAHIQIDGGTNRLIAIDNSKLYYGTAGTSVAAWAAYADAQGSPADYTVNGQFLKAVHDGRNHWAVITASTSDDNFLIDPDNACRKMGMLRPGPVSLAAITDNPTVVRPNASDSGTGWNNPANAYDTSTATFASCPLSSTVARTLIFSWASGGDPSAGVIGVYFGASCSGNCEFTVDVYTSVNGGSAYTLLDSITLATSTAKGETRSAEGKQWAYYTVPSTPDNYDDLKVKVVASLVLTGASGSGTAQIFDIRCTGGSGGTADPITAGTYSYAVTEVYSKTLADGTEVEVESQESPVASIVMDGATQYGVTVTLPTRVNPDTAGFNTTYIARRIYRSTSTGAWPDLGQVAEVTIDATSWLDYFETGATTLGAPSLNSIEIGGQFYSANVCPVGLYDLIMFNGALLGVPSGDRTRVRWSLPGYPEYWPDPHDMTLIPSESNDQIHALGKVGDYALIFLRTKVIRLTSLPFASSESLFDLDALPKDEISPTEGIVGRKAHCSANFLGVPVEFWVSDNGIWMTDGSLREESGIRMLKVSTLLDWPSTVGVSNLSSSHMFYDPIEQIVRFSYLDPSSVRKELWLHLAPHHMVEYNGQRLPKITGPHTATVLQYALGEVSGQLKIWSLEQSTGEVHNERTGTSDVAAWSGDSTNILSQIETGWVYPAGGQSAYHMKELAVGHSDWGPGQAADLTLESRTDATGLIQVKRLGVNMNGARTHKLFINRAGDCFRLRWVHNGKATGAFGPAIAAGAVVERR